ncbi:cell adhesion molecule DSCAM-like isoform X2 [Oscarella lobularis]|uniref:cell adhesion molecule DSCAM-like isoform X2 n=1 Tax=Oscarella lobularis TaxID=121494 RepID=UPI0033132243
MKPQDAIAFLCACELLLTATLVRSTPVFIVSPQTIEYVSPSGSLDVVCTTGDPSNITWHENDVNKPLITSKFTVTKISDRSRFHLASAGSLTLGELNTGRFCRATDTSDSSVTDSTVFTLRQGAAPTIGTASTNPTEGIEGNDVTLQCSFAWIVRPLGDIFWKFTAKGTTQRFDVGLKTTGSTVNALVLSNIQRNQAGTYTCYVRNEFGSAYASAVVTVLYKPTVTVSFIPSSMVKKGSSVTVTCRSDSFPVASVHSLFRNGVVIPENSPTKAPSNTQAQTIIERSYVITGSNETEGKYVCEANNTVGSGQSSEQELVVLLPPEAPTIVPSDAFDVCWSAGFLGRPPISNFSVSCTSKVNGACSKKPADFNSEVSATNFTMVNSITGVLCTNVSGPIADYTCTVSANNGAFDVSTPPTDVSTRPGKPGPVQISDVTNVINTGFTLSWCVEFSGSMNPLTSTIIGGLSDDKARHSYDAQTQQGSTVVTGLEPNTEYKVQIRVSNSLGETVSSERTQRTTCVPDVLNVTDAKATIDNLEEVTITFTDARNGPCNSNNDYVIRNGDTIWATVRGERGQDNIVTITFDRDSVPDQESELTIATRNGNDESQRSAAVSLQLLQGPVDNPTTDEPEDDGVIVAIVLAILVGIVILGIFIYLRIYHGRKLEAASEKGATGAPPIYAEPSSPEKNVPMQSSPIYEMSKAVHMHPNIAYEDPSKL